MFWRILLLGLFGTLAKGANAARPSEFYIVLDGTYQQKHDGAVSYQELLAVTADGQDSVIRYVRIEQVFLSACGRGLVVKAIEARLSETSPAELARETNPCISDSRALRAAQKQRGQGVSAFEPQEVGMIARCGSQQIKLRLVDPRIVRSAPRDLWELANRVITRTFPGRVPWNDGSEAADGAMQTAGAQLIPELSSGRYDQGLQLACDPRYRGCKSRTFRELLEDYQGPRSAAQLAAATTPRLLDANRYGFAKYVDPIYPVLAKSARIQGRVELRLVVDPPTGNVLSVTASSGHPMLISSATVTAKQWLFAPGWASSEPINVILDYSIRCPKDPP
jgi:TonB family protein